MNIRKPPAAPDPRQGHLSAPEPLHKFIAEHIALPIVCAFAAGVLLALHFADDPVSDPVANACGEAGYVVLHQLAQGQE